MSYLGWLNFLLLQWFFIRLARVFDEQTKKPLGWTWLVGVIPLTGWWSEYSYLRNKTIMRAGGPLVKDYETHFLRDDTEIRRSAGCFEDQIEAYSLFCVKPYGRIKVFAGDRSWAIEEADKFISNLRD